MKLMGKYQVVGKEEKKTFSFFHCNRNNVWHEWHELGSLLSPFAASILFFHRSVCKRFVQTKQICDYKYVWWWVRCVIRECDLCARVPEQDGNKNHAVCEYDKASCVTIPKREEVKVKNSNCFQRFVAYDDQTIVFIYLFFSSHFICANMRSFHLNCSNNNGLCEIHLQTFAIRCGANKRQWLHKGNVQSQHCKRCIATPLNCPTRNNLALLFSHFKRIEN